MIMDKLDNKKGERSKMDMDKGAILKEKMMDQKSWTREAHK